jgi:hypothetical protein
MGGMEALLHIPPSVWREYKKPRFPTSYQTLGTYLRCPIRMIVVKQEEGNHNPFITVSKIDHCRFPNTLSFARIGKWLPKNAKFKLESCITTYFD